MDRTTSTPLGRSNVSDQSGIKPASTESSTQQFSSRSTQPTTEMNDKGLQRYSSGDVSGGQIQRVSSTNTPDGRRTELASHSSDPKPGASKGPESKGPTSDSGQRSIVDRTTSTPLGRSNVSDQSGIKPASTESSTQQFSSRSTQPTTEVSDKGLQRYSSSDVSGGQIQRFSSTNTPDGRRTELASHSSDPKPGASKGPESKGPTSDSGQRSIVDRTTSTPLGRSNVSDQSGIKPASSDVSSGQIRRFSDSNTGDAGRRTELASHSGDPKPTSKGPESKGPTGNLGQRSSVDATASNRSEDTRTREILDRSEPGTNFSAMGNRGSELASHSAPAGDEGAFQRYSSSDVSSGQIRRFSDSNTGDPGRHTELASHSTREPKPGGSKGPGPKGPGGDQGQRRIVDGTTSAPLGRTDSDRRGIEPASYNRSNRGEDSRTREILDRQRTWNKLLRHEQPRW